MQELLQLLKGQERFQEGQGMVTALWRFVFERWISVSILVILFHVGSKFLNMLFEDAQSIFKHCILEVNDSYVDLLFT